MQRYNKYLGSINRLSSQQKKEKAYKGRQQSEFDQKPTSSKEIDKCSETDNQTWHENKQVAKHPETESERSLSNQK